MSFVYPLPTTGTISFSDFLLDENNLYINEITEATAQRGRVRATLKEVNKTDGPKDYMIVMKVIDDYLPYLLAIVDCLEGGQLRLKQEFETSWRCTLSDSVLKKKRVKCRGIYYELIFTLMTYGYACSNWASNIIEKELQKDGIDNKLKQAADILSKASVAIRKALMQQTSPSLLAKLAIGVAGHYEMANGLIKSLKESAKVCSDFRNSFSVQSLGKKFLAKDAYDHQQNGRAVGFITEAREVLHLLTKCKSPTIAAHAAQEYSEVNELYNIYVGINDTRWDLSNSTCNLVPRDNLCKLGRAFPLY
ncbi:17127_t:CDS:2 [Cetraspora pellucida]|uniref:17127_t:CDS:1 n=1 Tax=Cetraspora pellucida TaxID=1433469 RepID=A0ACA9KVC8_9GLOM|nr:17127_t:CDS:2 [Cetraspora pellucida]